MEPVVLQQLRLQQNDVSNDLAALQQLVGGSGLQDGESPRDDGVFRLAQRATLPCGLARSSYLPLLWRLLNTWDPSYLDER